MENDKKMLAGKKVIHWKKGNKGDELEVWLG